MGRLFTLMLFQNMMGPPLKVKPADQAATQREVDI
ncbi:hypothetical protein ABENE_13880 [Asticcacaulis benevestitus DSM 16100 = ATCC BAA-896]|uniref:Uncharacterized protein n=1 Tax=Asticcacaulis benevestitus DSM 16100 = ATCC BAA-896 TaxID=1121022 RepID=V4PQ57_9CAUL|nr:hypothetical protein ABENE_13880 [Asticcacaulis benevestitus DSM 16100 = ATCC BAA-896]